MCTSSSNGTARRLSPIKRRWTKSRTEALCSPSTASAWQISTELQRPSLALESAAKLNDKNPDIFFLLGDLYSDLKKFDEAAAAYRKSLEMNPKQKGVHFNLGTLLAEQKKFDEAMAELKLALELDPNYSAAWSNLALVAENLELDKEAIQAHEKVVALGKGQALNYFHLGVLYAKANQPDPAIAAFARAIELEPDKYRPLLKEELKKVHSVLDPVRYKESFTRLLND